MTFRIFRHIAILSVLFLLSIRATAQIQAPDFLCLKGDTLIWDLPTNNCGPFNSYDIYTSSSSNGPFSLLASVIDPAQTSYIDPNPNNDLRYYYLVSNVNCPGQLQLSSDTLDNLPPDISPINFVSVQNGKVELSWTPSPSPEVFAYIIYRRTNLGDVPVDTVFSGSSYTDLSANPGQQSESYFVNALDHCGNTSLFDDRHRSIFLEGSTQPCEQTISLKWNPYQSWPDGLAEQQLWLSVDGGAFNLIATIPVADSTYIFGGISDGASYCFFVKNIASGSAYESNSNIVCIDAEIVRPIQQLNVESASVNEDGTVTLRWLWNDDAEINQFEILRSGFNGNYEVLSSQSPTFPLQQLNTFTDTPPANGGPWYYTIRTTDDCDTVAVSTYGSTVLLSGSSSQTGTNLLTWTTFDQELTTVSQWELYRVLNGLATKVANLPGTETQYTDNYEPGLSGGLTACYYLVAKGVLTPTNGSPVTMQSRSNFICIEQPLRILIPNAIAPEGFNQEFKVLVVPEDFSDFDLRIFNRYGEQVFHTTQPDEGWRGTKDAKKLPQGVYVYTLSIKQASGKEEVRKGTIMLIR